MFRTRLPWVILILLGLWVIREIATGSHGRVPWILLILLVFWVVHRFYLIQKT